MKAPKFTSGKYANAICDVCGIRCKYTELRPTFVRGRRTGLLTCATCWNSDHPQNFLDKFVAVDPQALRHARPDTGAEASRRLFPPGNWINGQRPDLCSQEALMTEQLLDNSNRQIATNYEFERFWDANQRLQRGEQP
jgi:hypothetical protein